MEKHCAEVLLGLVRVAADERPRDDRVVVSRTVEWLGGGEPSRDFERRADACGFCEADSRDLRHRVRAAASERSQPVSQQLAVTLNRVLAASSEPKSSQIHSAS